MVLNRKQLSVAKGPVSSSVGGFRVRYCVTRHVTCLSHLEETVNLRLPGHPLPQAHTVRRRHGQYLKLLLETRFLRSCEAVGNLWVLGAVCHVVSCLKRGSLGVVGEFYYFILF